MAHLSKRLLAIALVVAVAAAAATGSGVVGENNPNPKPKHTDNPIWCIAKPKTPQETLEKLIDKLCSMQEVDCSPIEPNGPCYYPATYIHHASYAMNYHFHVTGGHPEDCLYGGYGYVVKEFPHKTGGCYYHPHDDKNHQNHPQVQSGHHSHSEGQNHPSYHAAQHSHNAGQNHPSSNHADYHSHSEGQNHPYAAHNSHSAGQNHPSSNHADYHSHSEGQNHPYAARHSHSASSTNQIHKPVNPHGNVQEPEEL